MDKGDAAGKWFEVLASDVERGSIKVNRQESTIWSGFFQDGGGVSASTDRSIDGMLT